MHGYMYLIHCVKNIFCASVEEQAAAKVLSLT